MESSESFNRNTDYQERKFVLTDEEKAGLSPEEIAEKEKKYAEATARLREADAERARMSAERALKEADRRFPRDTSR